mmetsp:Transcript_22405/g.16883  ORF Transcript_22405/g.16883 Transcript_22405/m.16883 type:complete len:135 (+) Transcript_22405:1904-2308(+)
MTASRQSVAQENKWSLEELELKFELDPKEDEVTNNPLGFIIKGLSIEGAEYNPQSGIILSEKLSSQLPLVNLKWVNKNRLTEEEKEDGSEFIQIPVYLNKERKILLFSVKIPTNRIPQYTWYQRGVALFAWNKD